ncbi:unnamed protein product [Clonostachys byssicola]|uniref:Rhodopsin domain-containing protein n=1 Tax=Clonostachys byssicola TaxID=160290 RepID=A0A9N9Y9N6_9HYPO|nr:unnamed protein product [Clonostachys byssicola]
MSLPTQPPPLEGFHVFDSTLHGAAFVVILALTPITLLATGLRFAASRISNGVGKEDWLALAALIFYLAWALPCIHVLLVINGRDQMKVPLADLGEALKTIWALGPFFAPNQLCAKLSILSLYQRLFGINKTYVKIITGIAVVQLLWAVETIIIVLLQCNPVPKYWNPLMPDGYCINVGAWTSANESVNSAIDFGMAALAVIMLRHLQTTRYTKWRLAVVFIMGGFAGIIGFIKIALSFNANVHDQIQLGLWATIQMACSVWCCCAIAYGPLLKKYRVMGTLTSWYGSNRSRSRPTQASMPSEQNTRGGYIDLEDSGRQKVHVNESHGGALYNSESHMLRDVRNERE